METKIIRSNRKTLSIQIKEGAVIIRAPYHMPEKTILYFISTKQDWINKNQWDQQQRMQSKKTLGDEATLPVLGVETSTQDMLKDGLSIYYKQIAKDYLDRQIPIYSAKMNLYPRAVKIGSAKTSHGSCNYKNEVTFSWRLFMADPWMIDYVIVHELCHMVHHNHSNSFWLLVEQMMPDFEKRRAALKSFEKQISLRGTQ